MPRLIDFDKLMEQYDFYNEFAVHDLRYLKKEYLPFVEAIPIEWLKEWGLKEENYYLFKDLTRKLIEDWKKEK